MDDLKALLNVLAGRGDEVIEAHDSKGVWRKAKFSHRHPTRKLLVFGLGDDMHGLFCWEFRLHNGRIIRNLSYLSFLS